MRRKLGLTTVEEDDRTLAVDFLSAMAGQRVADFTLAFRHLSTAALDDEAPLRALWRDPAAIAVWLARWRAGLAHETATTDARVQAQRATNPIYIPRNHQVEAALGAAVEHDDLAPFERLLAVLLHPFDEQLNAAHYALPATDEQAAGYRTFCGT